MQRVDYKLQADFQLHGVSTLVPTWIKGHPVLKTFLNVFCIYLPILEASPGDSTGKESTVNAGDVRDVGSILMRKIPWRGLTAHSNVLA